MKPYEISNFIEQLENKDVSFEKYISSFNHKDILNLVNNKLHIVAYLFKRKAFGNEKLSLSYSY